MKTFSFDPIALLLILVAGGVYFLLSRRRLAEPLLYFSELSLFKQRTQGPKKAIINLPMNLKSLSMLLLALAFIDPHLETAKPNEVEGDETTPIPTEGIAIYLLLDQSSSMKERVDLKGFSKHFDEDDKKNFDFPKKIDLMKKVTTQFIMGDRAAGMKGRKNDLIGLVAFARRPQIISPLTLDHSSILRQIRNLDIVQSAAQDGTAIGYALYKTASIIASTQLLAKNLIKEGKPAYEIKSSAIILVTDGLQDPNPLDKGIRLPNMGIEEAADFMKKAGIRLYIVNIEPKFNEAEFAPHRRELQRVAELTGGKFYLINDKNNLSSIYAQIDSLEKNALPEGVQAIQTKQLKIVERLSFYPLLVACALLALAISFLLETTLLRKVP